MLTRIFNRRELARDLRTMAITILVASMVMAAPSVAAGIKKAKNSDKVDGIHAVKSTATPTARANKLVATDASGFLPGDIVKSVANAIAAQTAVSAQTAQTAQTAGTATNATNATNAANADKLDGIDSTGLLRTTVQPGQLVTGFYSAWGTGPGYTSDTVRFVQALPAVPASAAVIPFGGPYSASCPGVGQAAAGAACIYVTTASNVSSSSVFDPVTGSNNSVNLRGFGLYFACGAAGGCYSYGAWAVRPAA